MKQERQKKYLMTGKKEESKTPLSAPPSKPLSEPHGFDAFMEIYPKRAGGTARPAAAKAFKAALRRGALGVILDGAKRYAAHCDAEGKTGTQFVYKARTWLNDSGWNETYETARTNHKPNTIAGGFDLIDRAIAERFGSGETDIEDVSGLLKIAS